jgi:mannose-6-phosphate isomerase-like protein (cupin superfamily)
MLVEMTMPESQASGWTRLAGMDDKVILADALATFDDRWAPRIIGRLNDYKVMVVKAEGDFVWHSHPDTDDFFLVVAGRLTIELRDRTIDLGPGEVYIVPRGVEHRTRAEEEAHVLLIEPAGTPNTGDAATTPASERDL